MERVGTTTGPLDAARVAAAVCGDGRVWTDIRVVAETGSTNADALRAAASGARAGLVIAAEAQTAGRGRQGRDWLSQPGSALTFSVLLRPVAPQSARGWLPLLAGVAVAGAVRAETGVDARLKWPNDVLAGGGKLAGVLAEQAGDAIVVGIGINVGGARGDLPVPTATSLQACGASPAGRTDRTGLLAALLGRLEHWYLAWDGAGGDPVGSGLRAAYLELCATIGQRVRAELPGGRHLAGVATGIDGTGRLLIGSQDGTGQRTAVSAGDVVHVR